MTAQERRDQGATAKRNLVDEIVARRTEKFTEADVYLDGEAWSEAEAIRAQIHEARRVETLQAVGDTAYPLKSVIPSLENELLAYQERLEASKVTFRFHSIGALPYSKLIDAHPSADPDLMWDAETFTPALIAAACVAVEGLEDDYDELDLEQVEALGEVLDRAQYAAMFQGALTVQTKAPAPFTYAATGLMGASVPSLTTALKEASATPGS